MAMTAFTKAMLATIATSSVVIIAQTARQPDRAKRNGSIAVTLVPWLALGIVAQDVADAHWNPEHWD